MTIKNERTLWVAYEPHRDLFVVASGGSTAMFEEARVFTSEEEITRSFGRSQVKAGHIIFIPYTISFSPEDAFASRLGADIT